MSVESRFWKYVRKGNSNECWIWTGYKLVSGYGRIGVCKAFLLAHRLSYILHIGDIPKNLCVLHSCDTPLYVNPNHLFLGTREDNNREREEKGRGRYKKN